ncbi:MAG: hypothetical protein KGD66_06475 [Candidatus Lokiarchaeota archaeon]|nr:hypothetical protein [Candidatus Lokiarchaeota archaeon]
MSNEKSPGDPPERKELTIVVYQFNDQIGDFEELIIDPDINLSDLLDDDFILLFIDPKHYRVWLWHGWNTTTRMKFISAKMAQPIRDKHGIAYKLTAVDQDGETHGFKVMIGIEEEIDYTKEQTGPAYEGTNENLELLESLSREKILLILEKAGIPEDYDLKMVIVKNTIYGYREFEKNYLGSVIREKQLFTLKEEIDDGSYLAEGHVPRMIFSYNNVVLTQLLQKIEVDDSIKNKSLKDLDI